MSASRLDNGTAVPRLALTKAEAAEALGVSVDFFEDHVMLELRIVRRGRRRLIPVAELVRWLESSADLALPNPSAYPPRERERKASSNPAASRSLPGIKWP